MCRLDLAIESIRNGRPVVLVDDIDREWEGDIVLSASNVTRESIAFVMLHARGLMCLPCLGGTLDRLEIPPMVENNTDPNQTPFTVSVDARHGVTTGMSADDKLTTIKLFTDRHTAPDDFTRPGHLFPLRARDGLLEERRGHTEGSVALMLLAGLAPIAVICEIISDDGTMTKGKKLQAYALGHGLHVISIEDVYERTRDKSV